MRAGWIATPTIQTNTGTERQGADRIPVKGKTPETQAINWSQGRDCDGNNMGVTSQHYPPLTCAVKL